jgi:arylsulfatase A-like enzyme
VIRRAAVAISGAAFVLAALLACERPAHASAESATSASHAAPAVASRPDAPSVLLLTLDTTRADALHCYGAPAADASPRLDAFAAEGVRFTQARTTAPMSLPSHASLFTGQWPFVTGVRDNTTFRLGDEAVTLAERFKAAGFTTGAVVASFTLHSMFGLKQGFDVYLDPPSTGPSSFLHQDERTAAQVTDECLRLLDTKALAPPFFLWAHYFDPHFPYEPPEPFLTRFLARAAPNGKGRARYAGEVAYMDQEIGRLLDSVRARMGARPLVILAVADHGEALGDHGEDSHGMLLYDPTVRVPLLLAGSGVPRGVVDDDPVSTVDVAPTLLELAGVAEPDAASLPGTSLLTTSREARAQRPLYYEALSAYFGYGWSPLFAVGLGNHLLIEAPHPELYDVVADPGETKNLVDEHADVAERMRQSFERWRAEAAAVASHAAARPDPTPEQRQLMLQLGYVSAFADVSIAVPEPGRVDAARRDPRDGAVIVKKIFEMQQLVQQKRHPAALELARQLIDEDPDNPMVQVLVGSLLIQGGDAARGVPLLEKAAPRRPDPALRLSLAQGYELLGRRDDALALLAKLVVEHPEFLRARLLRGELLLESGRKDDAARELEALLAAAPKADELRKRAQELLEKARAH